MGKGGKGGKKIDHSRPGGPKWKRRDDRDNKSEYVKEKKNPHFDQYYKEQNILSDDEWAAFTKAFQTTLPLTFRLTGSRSTAQDLNDVIKSTHIPHLTNVTFEGEPVPSPTQLPWYPEGLGWQLNVSKTVIRKQPEFKKFQDFLVYETDVGNISRQEAVSMIPPLVLDVEPHHKVLDMCAAPGSKTAQLIDALHSGPSGADPTGVVIANDSDFRRAYMLVHQSARLHSTAMMVTNLDASAFPTLKIGTTQENNRKTLWFDRILCDVPCSGDGTLRKNMQIWNSWAPGIGNGLHPLQLRILLRAMGMLGTNGRIVYSTCSLNPIENEAVLAAALNATPGQFRLVDVSDRLPGLIRRPGLSTWRVGIDKPVQFFDSHAGFLESLTTDRDRQKLGGKLAETMFVPENVAELHLERSMRIYPHLQDTGGFFVAVLERVAPAAPVASNPAVAEIKASSSLKRTASNLSDTTPTKPTAKRAKVDASEGDSAEPSTATATTPVDDADTELAPVAVDPAVAAAGTEEAKVSSPPKKWKEAPYTFLPRDNRHLKSCLTKLHVSQDAFDKRIFVRTADTDSPRAIYVCNNLVRDIIIANDPARMRLINCGVKMFTRQGNEKAKHNKDLIFRFVYEGVEAVLPFVEPSFILSAGLKELKTMLQTYYPGKVDFAGSKLAEQVAANVVDGAYLVRFEPGEFEGGVLLKPTVLPIWTSAKSITLMTDKQTKSALCLRLFGEDFTPFGKDLAAKKLASGRGAARPAEDGAEADAADDAEEMEVQEELAADAD
ncbi:S-adenosyl-L-methionine-dependent methyltransferase [Clavulina sp. PMI_390]|nr:S-adenosyl-L-methionine-dependent methyltransferase [Clavulina sp. PMI_390]